MKQRRNSLNSDHSRTDFGPPLITGSNTKTQAIGSSHSFYKGQDETTNAGGIAGGVYSEDQITSNAGDGFDMGTQETYGEISEPIIKIKPIIQRGGRGASNA
jgi:hypothetical protein